MLMFLVTCFIKLNARANYRHPSDISLSTIDTRGACRRQIACLLLRVCLLTQERSGLQSATINYIVKNGITLCKESLCLSHIEIPTESHFGATEVFVSPILEENGCSRGRFGK